jgi:hypothetical protein
MEGKRAQRYCEVKQPLTQYTATVSRSVLGLSSNLTEVPCTPTKIANIARYMCKSSRVASKIAQVRNMRILFEAQVLDCTCGYLWPRIEAASEIALKHGPK